MSVKTEYFSADPGFCSDCGSILTLLQERGGITCYTCNREFTPEVLGSMEVKYTIFFNSREVFEAKSKNKDSDEGPIVERKCPQCGNDKMSYATLQLRSADEGQTVFYTCTKCKFKENENS